MPRAPLWLLTVLVGVTIVAPHLAPYGATERFDDHLLAPPMRLHLDRQGAYVVPLRLVDRLEQRFEPVPGGRIPLPWTADAGQPALLLGADGLGRDVLSRTLHGARTSLGLALLATIGTLLVGALLGAWAGLAGGRVDVMVNKAGDILLVLPLLYAVVALRAALPLVLSLGVVVTTLAAIFVLLGWPRVARGVRAIVRAEAQQEHVFAARALGASRWRILVRHVLPACAGFLAVQTALLVPMFVLAESTLSYVGLGFPDGVPSWGTALTDAATVSAITRAPWTLAPAVAIFAVVLVTNLLLDPAREDDPSGTPRTG
jgi:peptide/nickel transport system permease protein